MTLDSLRARLAHRYRLERELGRGGMATVYLAEDLKHKRKVALKVLRPELAAVLGAERFVQEITTTASLQHPHILPLFDSGSADGFLYYVMPYIEGETLRDKLNRETQLGIEEAVRIATEVADALDYAHRQGVIHRDIKPENVLLHDGRPMVADFGIALAVSAAAGGRMTETGLSLGTPHYMSPEQATAGRDLTNRSDIYSLGSVLYEMLTGNPPHVGASAQQIIMKIVTEEAAPVTTVRKSVPPNVAAAVAKALQKLPADRFDSAKAFADALNSSFAATTLAARAAVSPGDRRWRLVAGGLSLALALTGGLAALGWMRGGPPGVVRRFSIRLEGSQSGYSSYTGPLISPDGTQVLYQSLEGALHVAFHRCARGKTASRRRQRMVSRVLARQQGIRSKQVNPISADMRLNLGLTYTYAGRLDDAVAECRSARELDSLSAWVYFWLADAHRRKGEFTAAIHATEGAVKLDAADIFQMMLAGVYASAGRREQAAGVLARLESESRHRYVSAYALGWAYHALGDTDRALEHLARAVNEHAAYTPWINSLPEFAVIRDDPRFQALLQRMNLAG